MSKFKTWLIKRLGGVPQQEEFVVYKVPMGAVTHSVSRHIHCTPEIYESIRRGESLAQILELRPHCEEMARELACRLAPHIQYAISFESPTTDLILNATLQVIEQGGSK